MDSITTVKSFFNTTNETDTQDRYECPPFPVSLGPIEPWPFSNIRFVIDGSGSTDNSMKRSATFDPEIYMCLKPECQANRRGCQCAPGQRLLAPKNEPMEKIEQPKPQNPTKTIILAELEMCAHTACEFMGSFDFTNVELSVHAFSSTNRLCCRTKLKSNVDAYNYLSNLDSIVQYECGCTNIFPTLNEIFTDAKTTGEIPFIVLATDGDASDKEEVRQLLEANAGNFGMICIGAGSIGKAAQAQAQIQNIQIRRLDRLIMYTKGMEDSRTEEEIETTILPSASRGAVTSSRSSSSECQISYLKSLWQYSRLGCYVGAFKRYAEGIESIRELISLMKSMEKFVVCLDGDTYGRLSQMVQDVLSQGLCCYTENAYGKYVVTPKYQIRVEPLKTQSRIFCVCQFDSESENWEDFRCHVNEGRRLALKTGNGSFDVEIQTTSAGLPRISLIHKI